MPQRSPVYNFATGAIIIMKRHKFKIISLLAVFVLSVSLACVSFVVAGAETTYTPSNVFSTSGATTVSDQGYIAYDLQDGANVYYRKDLALKWYASADGASYFSTEFSFGDSYNFEKFTMTLEAAPFTSNKEGKSANTLEFTVGSDGALDVSVNGAAAVDVAASESGTVTVALSESRTAGNFVVSVNNVALSEEFTDIGMNYADYASSSSDTPLTPLTFNAELKEGQESQRFIVRSLNGQSLALNDSGSVVDDTAPVLVVNSDVKLFILGSELDFDYVAIDVLDSSVSTSRYYYAYDVENPRVQLDPEEGETTYETMDSDRRFFESDFAGFNGEGYLSVAYRLSDGDNSEYYYIEWFVSDPSVLSTQTDGYSYFRVVTPGSVDTSPKYTFTDDSEQKYQNAVDDAAVAENEDGTSSSIQVGTGAYYYIPSLQAYIQDETCGYTDMTFDLYWRTGKADTQSSTGLSYDELSIELTAEGKYEFRIIPVNRLGNAMEVTDKNGNKVSSVSTSNVWDLQEIPTFTFEVQYSGLTIEEPEDGEDGYIDVTYTFDAFEIISLSDSNTSPVSEYKLYYLVLNDTYEGQTISLTDLRASLLSMNENGECTYGTWVEIVETDNEDEESDYVGSWDSSALSFVPKVSGYFGVTVRAYDSGLSFEAKSQAQVANISSRTDTLPGDTYWLRNNVLSVVFICIGGACLIGIIVLLLIKPKDKKAANPAEAASSEADGADDLKTKRKNRK